MSEIIYDLVICRHFSQPVMSILSDSVVQHIIHLNHSQPHVTNILSYFLYPTPPSAPLQVEKTRHLLLLREKLAETAPHKSLSESLSPSMSSGTLSTSTSISSQISSTTFESAITPSESSGYDSADIESLVDREKELATKVRARGDSSI